MRIAGIDLSTHAIDVVTVPLEGVGAPVWHRFPLEGPTSFDRARRVRDAMPARTSAFWDEVTEIGIEEPAGFTASHAMRIQGGVLACLPPALKVTKWMPSQWRKAAGLKGNASKSDVYQYVASAYRPGWTTMRQLPWRHGQENGFGYMSTATEMDWPQDACDAYCVALATRAAITIEAAA